MSTPLLLSQLRNINTRKSENTITIPVQVSTKDYVTKDYVHRLKYYDNIVLPDKWSMPRTVIKNLATNSISLPNVHKLAYTSSSCFKKEHRYMALSYISLILISQLLLQIIAINAKVSSIIVFGDSSVDSGNNNYIPTVLKSNFRPYGRDFDGGRATGRFSNGRVPTDFISEAFGLKRTVPAYLDPSYTIEDFATGVCFASAGTGYDNITSRVLVSNPPPPSFSLSLYIYI